MFVHGFFTNRLPKARPAGTGVELCGGAVEWIPAGRTDIDSLAVIERVAIQRWCLCATAPHHEELLWRHDNLPFLVREMHLLIKRNRVELRANLRCVQIARRVRA